MFACVDTCRKPGTTELAEHKRASFNCALPGFDVSKWTGDRVYQIHMGRPRDYAREGKAPDWAAPTEPVHEAGCPGAWYRTAFLESVLRYYRRRDDHGNRVANPAFDQCTDPLVHEAVLLLEAHEDNAIATFRANYYERMKREASG